MKFRGIFLCAQRGYLFWFSHKMFKTSLPPPTSIKRLLHQWKQLKLTHISFQTCCMINIAQLKMSACHVLVDVWLYQLCKLTKLRSCLTLLIVVCRTDVLFSPDDQLIVTGVSLRKGETSGRLVFLHRNTLELAVELEVSESVSIRTRSMAVIELEVSESVSIRTRSMAVIELEVSESVIIRTRSTVVVELEVSESVCIMTRSMVVIELAVWQYLSITRSTLTIDLEVSVYMYYDQVNCVNCSNRTENLTD